MSLYVHIPYCEAKCHYCDFNSYAGREAEFEAFTRAICADIVNVAAEVRETRAIPLPLHTLFFGGGTPSVLPAAHLDRILCTIEEHLGLADDAELSSEANPGSLNASFLHTLLAHGLRRLSLGIQSLDDVQLRALGRVHDRVTALAAVDLARRCGVPSLSLDLIFGVPGQTCAGWESMLDDVLALQADHLSLYGLIVEEATTFGRLHREGRLQVPDDDAQADMFEVTRARLQGVGYEHYEISNYARPGHRCRHNLVYWSNGPYAAVGPGAVSYLGGWRMTRKRRPAEYIRCALAGESVLQEGERVDAATSLVETLVLGLRTRSGVNLRTAWSQGSWVGVSCEALEAAVRALCGDLLEAGFLELDSGCLRVTPEGVETSNLAMERLMDLPKHLEWLRSLSAEAVCAAELSPGP